MSQPAALLRARLDSGAHTSCSGRPHVSPHLFCTARRPVARQAAQLAQRGTVVQQSKRAIQAAARSDAGPRSALQRKDISRCSSSSTGNGRWQRRARSRLAEEETASEEDDLDTLVDDDSAAGGIHSCLTSAGCMRPARV